VAGATGGDFEPLAAATTLRRKALRMSEAIRGCYERSLERNPSLKGKLVIRFAIHPDGSVTDVSATTDTIGDATLVTCVEGVVAGLRSGAFPREPVWIELPFVFAPAPATPIPSTRSKG
jgi:hypothetical protein